MKKVYQATGSLGWKITAKETLPQGLDQPELSKAFETALAMIIEGPVQKITGGVALCLVNNKNTNEEILVSLNQIMDAWIINMGVATLGQLVDDPDTNDPRR